MSTPETTELRRRREQITREVHSAQLRIDNLTRWNSPDAHSIDGQVLRGLKAKRERLEAELIEIEAQLPPDAERRTYVPASEIRFLKGEWRPIGSNTKPCIIPDMPAFLRRPRP